MPPIQSPGKSADQGSFVPSTNKSSARDEVGTKAFPHIPRTLPIRKEMKGDESGAGFFIGEECMVHCGFSDELAGGGLEDGRASILVNSQWFPTFNREALMMPFSTWNSTIAACWS